MTEESASGEDVKLGSELRDDSDGRDREKYRPNEQLVPGGWIVNNSYCLMSKG